MTKAESAASRTQKTHFADDETLASIAALELEAADLRSCIKDLRERLAKAGIDVADAAELQYWRNVNADVMTRKDYADGMSHKERIGLLRIRALAAHPKGEDHGNG